MTALRRQESSRSRRDLGRMSFCGLCHAPTRGGAPYHEDCKPKPPRTLYGQIFDQDRKGPHYYGPETIRRELAATEPVEFDPWNPKLATGKCCHCTQPARAGWLICEPCMDVYDEIGRGATPVHYSLQRAYR